MVTGNDPENFIIDFDQKPLAEHPTTFFDTHAVATNGIDWIQFKQTVTKYTDPEELFQSIRKNSPHKLSDEEEKRFRLSSKTNALMQNLSNSIRYLAVVDYAKLTLSQNIVLYFKKGSLVYFVEQRLYYRRSDLLKQA